MNDGWIKNQNLNFYSVHVRAKPNGNLWNLFQTMVFSGISEITDTQLQSPVSQIIAKLSNN